MEINQILRLAVERSASDIHLSCGEPIFLRIDGLLMPPLPDFTLTNSHINKFLSALLSPDMIKQLIEQKEIDLAYEMLDLARFRIHIYNDNSGISLAIRVLSNYIPSLDDFSFPEKLLRLFTARKGLILFTGAAGTGKTTTLASIIDYINNNYRKHIITIEDPIEYKHTNRLSMVHQREIGSHTNHFHNALRSALRQDPDVILIGEMRDLESIRFALTAAETGHLIFATLHTQSAAQSLHRILDVFPAEEKELISTMLADSLQAVVSQILVTRKIGGRIPIQEIMICTPAIRNLIRQQKVTHINSTIQTSRNQGMRTMIQHLQELDQNEILDVEKIISDFTTSS